MGKKNKFDGGPLGGSKMPRPEGGKIEKPKDEKPAESVELRGCGDPNCNMCNPHLQGRGLPSSGTRSGRFSSGGPVRSGPNEITFNVSGRRGGSDFAALERRIMDMAMRSIGSRGGILTSAEMDGMLRNESLGEAHGVKREPHSLIDAREAVEEWLVKAPEQAFDDIIGNDEALAELRDAITAPVEHKELYESYGMSMPKGAMLFGPPGCGKTMFAKAAACEMQKLYGGGKEFISVAGASLQSPYVGVTEGHITAIFTFAREFRAHYGYPLLVFIDEAEVLFPDRTGRVRRVATWEESQVATFLAEMDGMQESGAFVLLATNRPEVIDQAVLRDGRCDFKIEIKRPTEAAIETIIQKGMESLPKRGDSALELAFAAVEGLFDPAKIIIEAQAFRVQVKDGKAKVVDTESTAFLLKHILSGAMAASIPRRATRAAFARDKAAGTVTGVKVEDVLKAVNTVFDENKGLDHTYALNEFQEAFALRLNERDEGKPAVDPKKLN